MTLSCQSHPASCPRDCTAEDWEVIPCFEVNFQRFVLFPPKYTWNFKVSNTQLSIESSVLPHHGEKAVYAIVLCETGISAWDIFNQTLLYCCLQNIYVPGLWKMQTTGKTGWKAPKELLNESAAPVMSGSTNMRYIKSKQLLQSLYMNQSYFCLMSALSVNCYYNWWMLFSQCVWISDKFTVASLGVSILTSEIVEWPGCMFSKCHTYIRGRALLSFCVISIVCMVTGAGNIQG